MSHGPRYYSTRDSADENCSLRRLVLPMTQSTHFLQASSRPGGTRFLLEYFSQCTQLSYLAIRVDRYEVGTQLWEDSWVPVGTRPKLELDTLKTLNISFWRDLVGEAYPGFRECVESPALQHLVRDGSTGLCFDSDCSTIQVDRFLAWWKHHFSILGRILSATSQITGLDAHISCNFASLFRCSMTDPRRGIPYTVRGGVNGEIITVVRYCIKGWFDVIIGSTLVEGRKLGKDGNSWYINMIRKQER